jgi:outer membrane protein TolC
MSPQLLSDLLKPANKIPTPPQNVAVGIPADLLRRRPDVRRAERQAAAQSARIGIAKADLYPRFAIAGSLGASSQSLSDLFSFPQSMTGSIGPSFRWPILNYGRLGSNVQAQEARFGQLSLAYQQSVLQAGREAEDAIYEFAQSQDRAKFLAESADAAQKALEVTEKQYRAGAVDYTPVFLFQGTLAQQQDQYAAAQGEVALNLIRLYRALGGGWEMRLKPDHR